METHPNQTLFTNLIADAIRPRIADGGVGIDCLPAHFKVGEDLSIATAKGQLDPDSLPDRRSITRLRQWLICEWEYSGTSVRQTLPLAVDEQGCPLTVVNSGDYYYPKGAEHPTRLWRDAEPELVAELLASNLGQRPLLVDPRKAKLKELTSRWKDPDSWPCGDGWTTPARPLRAINSWLKSYGLTPLNTAEGNALLAQLDEAQLASRAAAGWWDQDISLFYSRYSESSMPFTSCMQGESADFFELYDATQRTGRLKMLVLRRNGDLIGRALVWVGRNPERLYLDRVYGPGHRSTFDVDVVTAVKEFCASNGIEHTVHEQSAQWFNLDYCGRVAIPVPFSDPEDYTAYPYIDSMRYLCSDGKARNYQPSGPCSWQAQETNGGIEGGPEYVTTHNGDRILEEGAYYYSYNGYYYSREEISWSEYHGEDIPDEDALELYNGDLVDENRANYLTLHNGEYALTDDDDLVMLYDGEYAISDRDDITQMHDGNYALTGDTVELHNGDYALKTEAVELHDGEYALKDDPDLRQLPDGSYTLEPEEDEDEDEDSEGDEA